MKIGTLVGIVLLIIGGFIGLRGLNYTTERTAVKLGDVEAKVEERRTVPVWIGGVLFLAGAGLIVYTLRQR